MARSITIDTDVLSADLESLRGISKRVENGVTDTEELINKIVSSFEEKEIEDVEQWLNSNFAAKNIQDALNQIEDDSKGVIDRWDTYLKGWMNLDKKLVGTTKDPTLGTEPTPVTESDPEPTTQGEEDPTKTSEPTERVVVEEEEPTRKGDPDNPDGGDDGTSRGKGGGGGRDSQDRIDGVVISEHREDWDNDDDDRYSTDSIPGIHIRDDWDYDYDDNDPNNHDYDYDYGPSLRDYNPQGEELDPSQFNPDNYQTTNGIRSSKDDGDFDHDDFRFDLNFGDLQDGYDFNNPYNYSLSNYNPNDFSYLSRLGTDSGDGYGGSYGSLGSGAAVGNASTSGQRSSLQQKASAEYNKDGTSRLLGSAFTKSGEAKEVNIPLAGVGAAAGVAIGGAAIGGGIMLSDKELKDYYIFKPKDFTKLAAPVQNAILEDLKATGCDETKIDLFITSTYKIKKAELNEHKDKVEKAYEQDEKVAEEFRNNYGYDLYDAGGYADKYLLFVTMVIDGVNSIDDTSIYNIINPYLEEDEVDFIYSGIVFEEYMIDTEDVDDDDEEEFSSDIDQTIDPDAAAAVNWLKQMEIE